MYEAGREQTTKNIYKCSKFVFTLECLSRLFEIIERALMKTPM